MTPMQTTTKFGTALAAAITLALSTGCDSVLDTAPYDRISANAEIVDASTAQAALNGAYDALQSTGMYGLDLEVASELASDNVVWSGTLQFLADISRNRIQADNSEITSMWGALYRQLDRDNTVIAGVTALTNVPEATKREILGEAHFLRALSLHDLVKLWGAVPMPLAPITSAADAATFTRAPIDAVYDQILRDLDSAAADVANATDTRHATASAVKALRARVLFYRASTAGANAAADYKAALEAVNAVLAGRDTLTVSYADLFSATGASTAEDIFRVTFTPAESNRLGYYYLYAGRYEVAAAPELVAAYEPNDLRKAWSIAPRPGATNQFQATKFPTTVGAEHPHVIRLAELVLMKAEILARQGDLAGAVAEYDKVRVRAGLPKHVLGVDVATQQDVLAAIDHERRLELAFEGDRWPDLNRQGRAAATKGFTDRAYQTLFPIPLRDVITAPGLVQNPGYVSP
jgi:hypothetical protein